MKPDIINISILEDYQATIDGYLFRLKDEKSLHIAGIARYGEELEPMLAANPTDLLILDIKVQTSQTNSNLYPIVQVILRLKRTYPKMAILVISMYDEIVLIEKLVELGISGYIFKSDTESILKLAQIIITMKSGGVYFSQEAYKKLRSIKNRSNASLLSSRQLEVLSLCVAFPDRTSDDLAIRLGVSSSTFRNTLSKAYGRLGVHTRSAAIVSMQKLSLNETNIMNDSVPKT